MEPWEEGVKQHYDGVSNLVDEVYVSKEAKRLGNSAVAALRKLIDKLTYLTDSDSVLLTTNVATILNSLGKCSELGQSSFQVVIEFDKVVLPIVNDLTGVTKSLSSELGDLTLSFANCE